MNSTSQATALPPAAGHLSQKNKAVLAFIKGHHAQTRVFPTIREIQKWFGWASPFAAQRHLLALQRHGAISRTKGTSRWLTIR